MSRVGSRACVCRGDRKQPTACENASVLTAGLKVLLGAGLHGRSCPRMPASLPWSLCVFLNGSVVDLQHHVGCRCTARWFSYICSLYCTCVYMENSFAVHSHTCMCHTCTQCLFFSVRWPHALPWRPELRASSGPSAEDTGASWERAGSTRLAAAPQLPHPGSRPSACQSRGSQQCSQRRAGWEERPGEEHQAGAVSQRKQSHRAYQPITWNPAQSRLRPRRQRLGWPTWPTLPP